MVKGRHVFLGVSVALLLVVVAVASGAAGSLGKGMVRLVGIFGQSVALVRGDYVEDVPIETLEQGALRGLVERADRGGAWVPAGARERYAWLSGRDTPPFGLVLGERSSYPFVLEVLPGSPAAAAGLKGGELVERVGDVVVRAQPLWQTRLALAEAESQGRPARLTVIDRELRGKRDIEMANSAVTVALPTVERRGAVAVVRLWAVDRRAADWLSGTLAQHGDAAGVVVDLRGTALGDRQGAVRVAALIAGGPVEVRFGRRGGSPTAVKAEGAARSWRVVVCADATTAGAAEVALVALKLRGATLTGGESYGDTGERAPVAAKDGEVWLATSWALGPSGDAILGTGVKPDEVVRPQPNADVVLDRAVELAGAAPVAKAA